MDADTIDRAVTGCAAAHQRLLADIDGLTDEQARSDSLLPKWTVGHVLNHLVRNAEGISRVFAAAAEGRVVERYPGGAAGRDAGIEDGADRPAGEIVDDVRSTIWRLEQTWAMAPPTAWQGHSLEMSGRQVPSSVFPRKRWREVEIHHADLGLGFTVDDWSDGFVVAGLEEQLPSLRARIEGDAVVDADALRAELGDRRFLAWLYGRWSRADLPTLARWE